MKIKIIKTYLGLQKGPFFNANTVNMLKIDFEFLDVTAESTKPHFSRTIKTIPTDFDEFLESFQKSASLVFIFGEVEGNSKTFCCELIVDDPTGQKIIDKINSTWRLPCCSAGYVK